MKKIRGGTLFSGIGAPEVAMPWVDWRWSAEIEKFPAAVHKKRHGTKNLGDVTRVDWDNVEPVELIVFGSPCQGFSVAGKRLGLDDPRSNLALIALGIVKKLRPRWFLFENVPGLFSNWSGATDEDKECGRFVESNDFATFLLAVEECRFHVAWKVLDAQHFGVPQRRRRIFAVGHTRDWRGPHAVLFNKESLQGNYAARDETRPRSAASPTQSTGCRRFWKSLVSAFAPGQERAEPISVASTLQNGSGSRGWRIDSEAAAGGHLVPAFAFGGGEVAPTLRAMPHEATHAKGGGQIAVAFTERGRDAGRTFEYLEDQAYCLANPGSGGLTHSRSIITPTMAVRRLTVVECHRLMGLPDTFCFIYRPKKKRKITAETAAYYKSHGIKCFQREGQWYTIVAADGPMYRALGNSMAIPVIRYLGDRIRQVDEIMESQPASR